MQLTSNSKLLKNMMQHNSIILSTFNLQEIKKQQNFQRIFLNKKKNN